MLQAVACKDWWSTKFCPNLQSKQECKYSWAHVTYQFIFLDRSFYHFAQVFLWVIKGIESWPAHFNSCVFTVVFPAWGREIFLKFPSILLAGSLIPMFFLTEWPSSFQPDGYLPPDSVRYLPLKDFLFLCGLLLRAAPPVRAAVGTFVTAQKNSLMWLVKPSSGAFTNWQIIQHNDFN